MALTRYYGLANTDRTKILDAKGWTTLPTMHLYHGHLLAGGYLNTAIGYFINEWGGDSYRDKDIYYGSDHWTYSRLVNAGYIEKYSDKWYSFVFDSHEVAWHKFLKTAPDLGIPALSRQMYIGQELYDVQWLTANEKGVVSEYYSLSISLAFSGEKSGTISLYNGSKLLKSTTASDITYSGNFLSVPNLRVEYTPAMHNVSWHRSYFYNGLIVDGVNRTPIFSNGSLSYSFTPSNDTTSIVIAIGKRQSVAIQGQSGISSYSASYSRSYDTGVFTVSSKNVEFAPTSVSGSTGSSTLYIESGVNMSVSANAASGFVFSTSDGFISQTSGVGSLVGSNSSSLNGTIVGITKNCSFNVTASTYSITVSIGDHSEWGTVYIDTDGTTSKTLVAGQTYSLGFKSSRANYEAPTVAYWSINGTVISGNSYTADVLSGNVVAVCTLKQNAWPVSVSATGNGTVNISGRFNKESGASLANTGYLRADGSDYAKIAVTPEVHYSEVSASRVIHNLTEYSEGGAYAYSLAGEGDASAAFVFALSECVVKTATNNPDLCDVTPSAEALPFDSETPVTVYCHIKQAHILDWRVDYFEAGGAQYPAEKGGEGQFYYVVYPSVVGGKSELTFIPHLVSTSNTLTVTKSGDTSFATVQVSVDGVEESIQGDSWNAQVRENRPVICRAVSGFGGRVSTITAEGVSDPEITESQISFAMPSNDASVNFAIAEKDRVTLSLAVANATNPDIEVGKVTLSCDASASVFEEVTTIAAQSFQVYKDTIYTLTADDSDVFYTFSGWYLNNTFVSTELSIEINLSDLSSAYVARYVLRRAGTINVGYGTKSGNDVIAVELPADSQPFGLVITTPPDQSNPDRWVIGNNRYIDFTVLDDGISVEEDVTYVWTPVRVEVMADNGVDTWSTIWTYDANNPDSRSGRFVMRDSMVVRLVFTKVQAEGYARVQALFMDGDNGTHGSLSIYATGMLSYYSIGGVAEASCYIGRKAVLAAAVKPGYAFNGWWRKNGDVFVPVESNGAILTIDSVASSGATYYADFARSDSRVCAWNAGDDTKTFTWQSKVYVGAQFFAMRNVRIYSDAYPVTLTIMTATSPNGVFSDAARTLVLPVTDQSPRLIPAMRLEKYFAFKVSGASRINHIALGSSMEALK